MYLKFMFVSLVIIVLHEDFVSGQKSGTCAAKSFQLLGASPQLPDQGLCRWTTLGPTPDPQKKLPQSLSFQQKNGGE